MKTIFFDNFRGFSNTILPIKDVNFFIGENSSGKTSILKLIKLISDPAFWFQLDFNQKDVELGYFSEIVSKSSENQKQFTIGYSVFEENTSYAIVLKFINKEGIPELYKTLHYTKPFIFEYTKTANSLKYRYRKNSFKCSDAKKAYELLLGDPLKSYNYKKLKSRYQSQPTLFSIILSMETTRDSNMEMNDVPTHHEFVQNLKWFAPIRSEPKRTYDNYALNFSSKGDHIPYLLKNLFNQIESKRELVIIKKTLEKFGKESGLFEAIKVNPLGKLKTSPFEIHVQLNNSAYKISNVGYGVSQVLPLLIEILSSENTWFSIQQPEVHLHPRAQAAFGEFIFKAIQNQNNNFIIETHSDFLIDRFRLKLSENHKLKKPKKIDSQLVFFERNQIGNSLKIIEIDSSGKYPDEQPEKFRDFFWKEELNILKI